LAGNKIGPAGRIAKTKEDVEDEGMKRNKEEERKTGRRLGRDNQYTPHAHIHTTHSQARV
jgi:hypothetical protein